MGVGPADIQVLVLIGQGGVHVIHVGELHQNQALVDMVGGRGDGLAVNIEGFEAGEKGRVTVPGLDPDLAVNTVGVDDTADFDHFQFHGDGSFCVDADSIACFSPGGKRASQSLCTDIKSSRPDSRELF